MSFLKSLLTFRNSKSMRVQDDIELKSPTGIKQDGIIKHTQKVSKKDRDEFTPGCLKGEVLSRVFAEDYQLIETSILDPRGPVVRHWNELFLAAGMISLFVDPLFLFLPKMTPDLCIEASVSKLQVILTVLRILSDLFYVINILVQFRTAYVAPSSRVIGRGELVIDPWKIAYRYLHRGFWIDLLATLPFPQVMNWAIIPYVAGSVSSNSKIALRCIPLAQFLLRLFLLYPLSWKILKDTGKMTETAWVGAAHNMLLFYIASNVSGACWYLLTIERQEACWRSVCDLENPPCVYEFFDCNTINDTTRSAWFAATNVSTLCNPSNTYYEYGVYALGLSNNAPSEVFVKKYFFCFYWALQSLTSIGNNLATTGYVGENIFVNLVAVLGLVLLAALVGNMQRYLQSTSLRLEESRQKRTETEQWMHYRQIPPELRQSVRKYDQYRWVATRGVEEKTIISALPKDLQRKINNHLCNNLVRKVPLFDQMDDKMLDGICERLKAALYTEGTFLVREGDPVREMLFIIRGHLDSYTTNGGQRGFFNSSRIGPGNFCGEELLTWALDGPRSVLPSSTRTVKAISETEAFALTSEDLKFVALQFRMLHSRQLIQKFRFYSHQWRTWAACYVQAVWRRHQKRKELAHHNATDGGRWFDEMDIFVPQPGSGLEVYAARLITNIRMGGSKRFESEESGERPNEFNYDENEE
ncbi:putative cyclic nucleotide-gated ion channel 15 [Camellia lanceoleosa]|uniref:Cyclic nucleotide-gated ion channel 15 n=1 Tax=Camellia lanceoleosa TaxID=1840588 RepID=A0ACC0FSL2_9ERIC|nr:putative cyclic nucleotide-gated ion channel 15 [Camellia lanceoleosa]